MDKKKKKQFQILFSIKNLYLDDEMSRDTEQGDNRTRD